MAEHEPRVTGQPSTSATAAPAEPPAQAPAAPARPRRRWPRWLFIGCVAVAALAAGLIWGLPYLRTYFTTVSTDDAYVNGHVTNLSPRVGDFVEEVRVDDNDFVQAGAPLIRLDREPYQAAVAQKQAALEVAQAQLEQSRALVRAEEARSRAGWFQLIAAQEQARFQVATLKTNIANLSLRRADLTLAEKEYARTSRLVPTGAATQEELEQRQAALEVARNQVRDAEETVQQTRAGLGLPPDAEHPGDVPKDLDQTYSAVQVALSNAMLSLAQIGVHFSPHGLKPKEFYTQLEDMSPEHDINQSLDVLVSRSPSALLAQSQVRQAERDLAVASLNLSYTEIRAPISGVVDRRAVNPGDNVQPNQILMAIRSFDDVWIDANFKETQLDPVRIGQPADVYVDAYPGRVFKGRVAGFSSGTGSTQALLPAENATGNFVKVVQRLNVRVELTEPNPRDTPLFAGLSAVPYIRINEPASGPDAGQRLRTLWAPQAPAKR